MSRFGITLKENAQDVDILVDTGAKWRSIPKPEFDDKGRPKPFKPDPKDLDWKLGGVKGSSDDLAENTWVVMDLGRAAKSGAHIAKIVVVLGEEEKK